MKTLIYEFNKYYYNLLLFFTYQYGRTFNQINTFNKCNFHLIPQNPIKIPRKNFNFLGPVSLKNSTLITNLLI